MLDHLKVTTKALLPLGLMSALFLAVLGLFVASMSDVTSEFGLLVNKSDPAILRMVRLSRSVAELAAQSTAVAAYKCTAADAAKCAAEAAQQKVTAAFARSMIDEAIELEPANSAFYLDCKKRLQEIESELQPIIAKGLVDDETVLERLDPVYKRIKAFAADLLTFNNRAIAANAELAAALEASSSRSIWMLTGLGLAAIALGVAATMWMALTKVSRPLGTLERTMRAVAGGSLKVAVPGQARGDEIGAMAQAVEVFRTNGLKAVALEAEVAAGRAAAEVERSRAEVERAREAAEDSAAIEALGRGLDALANGNLTHQVTQALAPKTQQLKTDFNLAATRLRDTMATIKSAIQGMTAGTGEISQAADDLSKRTEQQAASLEQTAAALDQITATVRTTAEGASHAQAVVSAAKSDAEHSATIVSNAVEAMSAIEGSAQQISQIIGVIDEIAFQTNLLALNAGVEAARAGEAGRGFAVVASEVRALAQRSAEAAKEIKALISTSSKQVDRGVKLVGETGTALQRIAGQVGDVFAAISGIALSAQEQATGLAEVNTAINQMDQVTQQNAAMVEQSTAASHGLAQETEELARLTEHFQVADPRARPVAAPARASPVRPAKPAAKVVSIDSPRRAAPASAGGDGWEEF